MRSKHDIITPNIIFTSFLPSHITASFLDGINNPEVNRFLGDSKFVLHTLEDEKKYVSAILESENEALFAIIPVGMTEVVGNVHLTLDRHNKRCAIAYVIADRNYWGRGIATDAIGLATEWAFENLDINRMDAGYYDANPASGRVLAKNGYVIEGRRRKAGVLDDGSCCDEVLVGLLREEYEKARRVVTGHITY